MKRNTTDLERYICLAIWLADPNVSQVEMQYLLELVKSQDKDTVMECYQRFMEGKYTDDMEYIRKTAVEIRRSRGIEKDEK